MFLQFTQPWWMSQTHRSLARLSYFCRSTAVALASNGVAVRSAVTIMGVNPFRRAASLQVVRRPFQPSNCAASPISMRGRVDARLEPFSHSTSRARKLRQCSLDFFRKFLRILQQFIFVSVSHSNPVSLQQNRSALARPVLEN